MRKGLTTRVLLLASVPLVKWLETMTRAVTRSKAVDVTATFFLADFWAAEMG